MARERYHRLLMHGKTLRAGAGEHWSATQILLAKGFNVLSASAHDALLKTLARRRFDSMARSQACDDESDSFRGLVAGRSSSRRGPASRAGGVRTAGSLEQTAASMEALHSTLQSSAASAQKASERAPNASGAATRNFARPLNRTHAGRRTAPDSGDG